LAASAAGCPSTVTLVTAVPKRRYPQLRMPCTPPDSGRFSSARSLLRSKKSPPDPLFSGRFLLLIRKIPLDRTGLIVYDVYL
jgi:hypothetical protein